MMLKATFELEGNGPIGFSAPIKSPRKTGEAHDAYEERTWRERMHVDDEGMVFIPANAIKLCLSDCARYLGESVPGKKSATYTKHFEAGVLVTEPMPLGVKSADVPGQRQFVPSDGKKGGGKRVWKTFPVLAKWRTRGVLYLLDPVLIDKPEKVKEYLTHAGRFIGLGWFRPRNGGYFGRFSVTSFKTESVLEA
jgi:hypothetical protein